MRSVVQELRDAINRRQAVFILGAGVAAATSNNPIAGSWVDLLTSAVKELASDKQTMVELMIEEAKDADDLIMAAQRVRTNLGDNFGRWLSVEFDSLKADKLELLKAIGSFNLPIFTTNYDYLIEQALGRGSANWTNPDAMGKIALQQSLDIGHLHGIYDEPDSVVFDTVSYATHQENDAFKTITTSLFSMKQIVFIGTGLGASDPNFSILTKQFNEVFKNTARRHFVLCLDEDASASTSLDAVTQVPYGKDYADLVPFLVELSAGFTLPNNELVAIQHSEAEILTHLRESSLLSDDENLLQMRGPELLVVPPVFLPSPHAQFIRDEVLEKRKPKAVNLEDILRLKGGILLVAGEQGSGKSTALLWTLLEASRSNPGCVPFLIEDPLDIPTQTPISSRAKNKLRQTGDLETVLLGIDNLRVTTSARYTSVISNLASIHPSLTVVGVSEEDAATLEADLRAKLNDDRPVQTVHLGRFGRSEAEKFAELLQAPNPKDFAERIIATAKQNNLPRTPFTLILIGRLLLAGESLVGEQTPQRMLEAYINWLVDDRLPGAPDHSGLAPRQKLVLLREIAGALVTSNSAEISNDTLMRLLKETAAQLSWEFANLESFVKFLKNRRILRYREGTYSFSRSAYLVHLAAAKALEDTTLKAHIFAKPLEHDAILKSMAAQSRRNSELITLVLNPLSLLAAKKSPLKLLSPVHKSNYKGEPFDERTEITEAEGHEPNDSDYPTDQYDAHDDSDRPLLAVNADSLPEWKRAAIAVDVASIILRDTDELRDQELKESALKEILRSWVIFLELFEESMQQVLTPEFLDAVASEHAVHDRDLDKTDIEVAFEMTFPSVIVASGVLSCLSSPAMSGLLQRIRLDGSRHDKMASLIRTIALLGINDKAWIRSLTEIHPDAQKTYFSTVFLANWVRYTYITDQSLTPEERDTIFEFLKESVKNRYSFANHRTAVDNLNLIRQELDQRCLVYLGRSKSKSSDT